MDGAERMGSERAYEAVVRGTDQQSVLGDDVDQPPEGEGDLVERIVDVRVIELDVVDDHRIGQVMQELRPLVEEGAVVFVAFQDEQVARSQFRPGLPADGDAADDVAGVQAGLVEHPGEHGRRRGLAVRARHHDRFAVPEEEGLERLGHGCVPDLPRQDRLGLGIAPRDRVSYDHEVRRRIQVGSGEPPGHGDLLFRKHRAHGGIHVFVASGYPVAEGFEHNGERSHPRTADGHQMDVKRSGHGHGMGGWFSVSSLILRRAASFLKWSGWDRSRVSYSASAWGTSPIFVS